MKDSRKKERFRFLITVEVVAKDPQNLIPDVIKSLIGLGTHVSGCHIDWGSYHYGTKSAVLMTREVKR